MKFVFPQKIGPKRWVDEGKICILLAAALKGYFNNQDFPTVVLKERVLFVSTAACVAE